MFAVKDAVLLRHDVSVVGDGATVKISDVPRTEPLLDKTTTNEVLTGYIIWKPIPIGLMATGSVSSKKRGLNFPPMGAMRIDKVFRVGEGRPPKLSSAL